MQGTCLLRSCWLRASAVFALTAASVGMAYGQNTLTWTGASDDNWFDAANWSGTGAPPGTNASDIASFDSGSGEVRLTASTTIYTLQYLAGAGAYTLSGESGTRLTLSGVANSSHVFLDNSSGASQLISADLDFQATSGTGVYVNIGSGSSITLSGDVDVTGTAYRDMLITGGGVLNLTGRLSTGASASGSGINRLVVREGSTVNYNTETTAGPTNFWAEGGTINLLRSTGTTGISLSFGADNSSIYIAQSDITVGAQNVNFRGTSTGATQTFGANFSGTGEATYSGTVRLNSNSAVADTTYQLYAAENNTLILSGEVEDTNASASGTTLQIVGGGIVRFTGSAANTFVTPLVVIGSRLELAKDEGVNAIGGGEVTIGADGEVILVTSNQIEDSTALVMAGGSFDTASNSETLGALTISEAGGTINVDGSTYLTFASLGAIDGTLYITNWTESSSIVFTDISGWDSEALSKVVFAGYGSATIDGNKLVAAMIPEPASLAFVGGVLVLLVTAALRRRKG